MLLLGAMKVVEAALDEPASSGTTFAEPRAFNGGNVGNNLDGEDPGKPVLVPTALDAEAGDVVATGNAGKTDGSVVVADCVEAALATGDRRVPVCPFVVLLKVG